MARGGARRGAGRKKGSASRSNEEARRKAAQTGETPLDYMLRVMRDDKADGNRRDDMAKAAAPYIHAKLSNIEHGGAGGGPILIARVERTIVDPSAYPQDRDA